MSTVDTRIGARQEAVNTPRTPTEEIPKSDVQAALAWLYSLHAADDAALAAHIADTIDAHDASAISFAPVGTIAATDVQTAVAEVATDAAADLAAHLSDTTAAHAASAIANTPAGGVAATTVQAAINELDTEKIPLTYLDTDGALTANSDTKIATQKATKTYVGTAIAAYVAAQDVEVFKGSINCSANPNYPAADAGHVYRVSAAGKIGGGSGVVVEIGDRLECFVDGSASGNQATVGANWMVSQVNIDGAVVGPASATDGHIPQFDGSTGKLLKDGKAAPTGTIVGTSDSQSLTNKTIDAPIVTGLADVQQAIKWTGIVTPSQITSNQNDYAPTGFSTCSVLRLDTDASRDLTGLAGGASGRLILIHNIGANALVLKDESASSSAGNRFALSADVTLATDQSTLLQYDGSSSRWRVIGGTGSGSGTTIATQSDQETATSILVAVPPGRQQFHPSACKAWVRFTGTGTVTIVASYNVSSITDNGVGNYAVNFTTAFSSANYGAAIAPGTDTNFSTQVDLITNGVSAPTASVFNITTGTNAVGQADKARVYGAFFGDQ